MEFPDLAKEWSKDQILDDLKNKGKTADIELFRKLLDVGWKGLKGGNVIYFPEMSEEDIKANCENEYAAAIQLVKHYSWMTPDLFYIPRTHFKDIIKQNV
jgi:hypothetical protein